MANFNLTITNEGAAFLADVIANQGTINFSEVRFSSSNYVGSEATLTEGTFAGTFITAVPSASVQGSTTINVASSFTNATFTTDKSLYSIGVIADDGNGTDYLVAVATTSTPDILSKLVLSPSTYAYNINLAVSSTEDITVTASTAGAVFVADIVDNLTSENTNKPLSAKQGKVLKTLIDQHGGGLLPHVVISTESGSVVTLTKGSDTITATETSTDVYEANVTDYGTWTIESDLNEDSITTSLVVDAVKVYDISLMHIPDGSTVTPVNDIQTWLLCAGIRNKPYTTIAEVIGDSQTLLALISDNNAVDYMVRSTSFSSDICADALAMLYIGQYNYCADTLLSDSTWQNAIVGSNIFDLVLTNLVPVMTSDTTPSGEAIAEQTLASDSYAYQAFNDNAQSVVRGTSTITHDVGYDFTTPVKIYRMKANAYYYIKMKLQFSDDGITWSDASALTDVLSETYATIYINNTLENGAHRYWRFYGELATAGLGGIANVEFYGRKNTIAPDHILRTFATATDEEIAEMILRADRGEIDLYEDAGWRVGQEHEINIHSVFRTISDGNGAILYEVGEYQLAQSATIVLSNKGGKTLTNAVLDKQKQPRTECSFQWDLKNGLETKGYINISNSNSGSWKGCARRTWCNDGFFNALTPALRACIKLFKVLTAQTYNGTTNETVDDYCALRAEKEIFGTRTGSNQTEANALTQAKYYETAANIAKKQGDAGSSTGYWTRSPYYANATDFCFVSTSATSSQTGASGTTVDTSFFGVF